MPKVKLNNAYRFNGQVYGPSYGEAVDVPEEVARAAGYAPEIPVSDPAMVGTAADDPQRDDSPAPSKKAT